MLAHEQRQRVDSRRPREVARRTAKGRDRFGAHEQMDGGPVTSQSSVRAGLRGAGAPDRVSNGPPALEAVRCVLIAIGAR